MIPDCLHLTNRLGALPLDGNQRVRPKKERDAGACRAWRTSASASRGRTPAPKPPPPHSAGRGCARGEGGRLWGGRRWTGRKCCALAMRLWLSKPFWLIPFWLVGEFTTHFGTYFGGDWDVHWGVTGILTHGHVSVEVPAASCTLRYF